MSVGAGWPMAMPPVAGFLEMFAGVPYNREKNQSPALLLLPFSLIVYGFFKLNSTFDRFIMSQIVYFDTQNSIILPIFNKE